MADDREGMGVETTAGPDHRGLDGFGGLVPTGASARAGETVVCALVVEHYADGAAVPLLCLSAAPGVLGIDPGSAVRAVDDRGRSYDVDTVTRDAGLGAVQATLWLTPGLPADARRLELTVERLTRTSVGRRGGVERPLTDGPWVLVVDLLPGRTAVEAPARPRGVRPPPTSPRAPVRTATAFADVAPIGQARVANGIAVCMWAIERYGDRAVLSLGCLTADGVEATPLAPGRGTVAVWDDAGMEYSVAPIHGSAAVAWSESSLELTPAPPHGATLAIRLADLPGRARTPEGGWALAGPFIFGVALPDA